MNLNFIRNRQRAFVVSAAACGVTLLLAGGVHASAVVVLPAILMFAEFTGGWIAVATTCVVLASASVFIAASLPSLMFTVVCAFVCARAIRAGIALIVSVAVLAAASIAGEMFFGDGVRVRSPVFIATELLEACFNVALVIVFVVLRPKRAVWLPPVRRWRFEDILFLGSVAASVPAAMLLREGVRSVDAWWTVAVIAGVQIAVAIVGATARRLPRELHLRLKSGRVRATRQRSARLPHEIGRLFLSAREVSDGLHRRTAMLGLHLESARLRAGRLQAQVESIDRERRGVELALERAVGAAGETDRRWRAFVDIVPEALFITDHAGQIEYVSEGVRALLGYEPKQLERTRIAALIPAATSGTDPLELAERFAALDSDAPAAERIIRVCDSRGVLRELSAQVKAFRIPEGRRLGIRLREAAGSGERARDQFVATMSHEIRTPLHGLMATLDMLRSEELSEEGRRRLGIARTSAKTLIGIASDVLDLSRISAGGMPIDRRPMSLERLINDVVDEARAREEALQLNLHADFEGSFPSAVLGDPLRIKQVLRNLVSNALKFTAAGTVTVTARWSLGHGTIDVEDTGAGIPVERWESIFEAFVQGDRARSRRQGGAGLGLAIARQLSEAMGGSVSLLHSGPRGSTFRIALPLPSTDEVPLDEQSWRNLPAVKGRILVAEDDEASRYIAQTLLESLDCPATIVANGIEALELMRTGEFDLALLDCEMPGLDGYEVAMRFRKSAGRHIPIIAMTARTASADRQRCLDGGMDDLLSKPFGKSALSEILGKWLSPRSRESARLPLPQEVAMRPELDTEVFDELRQSLNWQLPPLRKIYQSVRESAQGTVAVLGGGMPADIELAQRRLHSLQGGAGLVGARQIEHIAARLGQSLREGHRKEFAEGLPLLLDVMRRFDRVLDRRLDVLNER